MSWRGSAHESADDRGAREPRRRGARRPCGTTRRADWSAPSRNTGNQRRFDQVTLRRVAFIQAAQRVGLSLDEVGAALATLPRRPDADQGRLGPALPRLAAAPRRADRAASSGCATTLDDCIGCGCLSLRSCALSNPDDTMAESWTRCGPARAGRETGPVSTDRRQQLAGPARSWPTATASPPTTGTGRAPTCPCRSAPSTAVLAAFGVDADHRGVRRAPRWPRVDEAPWRRMLPAGRRHARGHAPPTSWSTSPTATPLHRRASRTEDGATRRRHPGRAQRRAPPGRRRARRRGPVRRCPADLPTRLPHPARHLRRPRPTRRWWSSPPTGSTCPPTLAGQVWGLMTQLYSVRSRGVLGPRRLRRPRPTLARLGAELGADFVLVNPLHAAEPVPPVENSPYLPDLAPLPQPALPPGRGRPRGRRAQPPRPPRAIVDRYAARRTREADTGDLLDRQAAWPAKLGALDAGLRRRPLAERGRRRSQRLPRPGGRGAAPSSRPGAPSPSTSAAPDGWPDWAHGPGRPRGRRAGRRTSRTGSTSSPGCSGCATQQLAAAQAAAVGAGHADRAGHRPRRRRPPRRERTCGPSARRWPAASPSARRRTRSTRSARTGPSRPWRPDVLAELGYAPYRADAAHRAAARRRRCGSTT